MEFGADTWWIVGIAVTIAIGVISYFLKRTINKQDHHEEEIHHIKETYVTQAQLKEFKEETNGVLNKLQKDIEDIKENSLKKSDFLRQQAGTDKKLDKMYDLILEIRGGRHE